MAMCKQSSEHIPCTWCDRDALPNTDPPACELHKDMHKQASESTEPKTLKELSHA